MTDTALDLAFRAMDDAPGDDRLRLAFFDRLVDADLFLLLERQDGVTIEPRLLELEDGPVALVFDRVERLADVAPGGAPMAELDGRALVALLGGEGLGLGLNLGVAPSAFLLPPEGVQWLADLVATRPRLRGTAPNEVVPPDEASEPVIAALTARLPRLAGLAETIGVATGIGDGKPRLLVAVLGAEPAMEPALATTIGEALNFSGLEGGSVDVIFPPPGSALQARLRRVALCLEVPRPELAPAPAAPGIDPARPPKLR